MKKISLIIYVIFIALILISCAGPEQEPEPTQVAVATPSPSPSPSPTPSASPIPTTTEPIVPKSYTTGLPFDGEYKPVLVSIENSPAARPQLGLQTADVVYEIPVEGSITRFLCLFSDNVPEEVLPVRSARVPFLYVIKEWDCMFLHYGGSGSSNKNGSEPYNFYGHKLYDDIIFDVDGHSGDWNDYYKRVDYANAPHNVMGNPALAQQLYDYDPKPLTWKFSDEATYTGEITAEINLSMCSGVSNYITYKYDEQSQLYMRSMQGKPFVSKETNSQLSVKNIVVQYCNHKVDSKIRLWELTGEGKADFYIGGIHIEGSWKRESAEDQTQYFDSDGNQIILMPGNTWIHIHPND